MKMKMRIGNTARGGIAIWMLVLVEFALAETLHNGIVLPERRPPSRDPSREITRAVPCLEEANRPKAIPIDLGRQLFVDDALVASTNGVVRHWNRPTKAPAPVLRPTASNGRRSGGCAVATDGGLWWDPVRGTYRLWYEDDWAGQLCYAESRDGIAWEKPNLGVVRDTNRVFDNQENPRGKSLDSWTVFPDYQAKDPYVCWCLLISAPGGTTADTLYTSADGRSFAKLGVAGYSGDRTTLYFDAILGQWVFSLRDSRPDRRRCRRFHAQAAFAPLSQPYGFATRKRPHPDGTAEPRKWTELDEIDYGPNGMLYSFGAVPYESLTLGLLEILHNTPRDNRDGEEAGLPKQTSLRFAFSRDGRRFVAAPASAICPEGWGSGKWDTGYLSAMGGICTVSERELRFYYSGLRGDAEMNSVKDGKQPMFRRGMYYNGSIGYATLRRDGFAGLVADGRGEVVTKSLVFSGAHLFVNAECLFGEVAAEVLDDAGAVVPGFSADDCRGLKFDDTTKRELVFLGGTLASLAGRPVSIRFKLHCATLYSFWVSRDASGRSGGYVAAGGPDYPGLRDE